MKVVRRAITIAFALLGFAAWLSARRVGLARSGSPAQRFARLLERLGTPFVKLGQHLSLRSDLLPADYIAALQDMQDHVSPIEPGRAAVEIERALGRAPGALFSRFESEPFAAASIAQVHAAWLPDGRAVVVKVRRPDIPERIELDMRLLHLIVRILSPFSAMLRRHHAADVVAQVWSSLRQEIDLREEAANVRRFAEAFAGSPTIMVPRVIESVSNEAVMVQERSGGARVDRLPDPAMGPALARAFVDAYVRQFFEMGFFHGDPHPGNLFIMADGRICFHDFGIMGHLDRGTRQSIAAFMLGFAEQDSDWILDAWLDLGIVAEGSDRRSLRPVIGEILADCARRPLREWSMGAAFMRLVNASRQESVGVPLNLLVLARTLLLMESTVRSLDPEFSLLDAVVSRSREVLKVAVQDSDGGALRLQYEGTIAATEWRRLLATTVRHVRRQGVKLEIAHEGLPEFGGLHLKAANRVSVAVVALGLFLAASLLMQHSVGPSLWNIPILAVAGYVAAVWYSIRLIRAVGRGL